MGVDVARYGDDETVIAEVAGNTLINLMKWNGLSIDSTVARVMDRINSFVCNADRVNVDGVGLGAGVVDYLRKNGYQVNEIIAGATAIYQQGSEYQFKNYRSQMWWNMRELIRTGKVSINVDDVQLIEDLTAPKYKITGDKTIEIESKDETKKRINRSPDCGDAFVMALAPQMARASNIRAGSQRELGIPV